MIHLEFKIGKNTFDLWDVASFGFSATGRLWVIFDKTQRDEDNESGIRMFYTNSKRVKVVSAFLQGSKFGRVNGEVLRRCF